MIRWPKNPDLLPRHVQDNLEHFRVTGIARELEQSEEHWSFETLGWSDEVFVRLRLRNDRFEPLDVVLDGDGGAWRVVHPQEEPHALGASGSLG